MTIKTLTVSVTDQNTVIVEFKPSAVEMEIQPAIAVRFAELLSGAALEIDRQADGLTVEERAHRNFKQLLAAALDAEHKTGTAYQAAQAKRNNDKTEENQAALQEAAKKWSKTKTELNQLLERKQYEQR